MRRFAALALLLAGSVLLAGPVEVYGRPLRGLSAVPIADVVAHPERYRGKALRVTGTATAAAAGRIVVSEGASSLALESDGSFALPTNVSGARVTAEGTLRADGSVLSASGLEVRR